SVNIDKSFFDILTIAKEIYTESNGLYDVSIAELINLWNMGEKSIPNDEQLAQAIKKSGFNKVKISPTVLYRPHGLEINLGSISKGYIVDKTMDYLIKQGVEEAYINAGGDLKIYSKNNKKTRIGIQHPRIATDVIATLEVSNMAVVTSGDYERFFEIDGVRYHHILNPKTGYPAQNTISVTVISKTAVLADALSTALFVMSPEDGIRLIKKYPDTEAIIYYKSGDDLISLKTEGIKKYLISEIDFVKK
ncbi:MAG TPA: FAD:protein FMN transferase, partial [Candidatus Cloacimonadota bacterium]|nr:FAD:protein FMN transferase [Candidatus Cloacimonadota bacterium]